MPKVPNHSVKYSLDEWEKVQPALKSLSSSTLNTAKRVLVDGVSAPDVASENGVSRQTVHAAVKRVKARLESYEAEELTPLLVWLPRDAVEEVAALVSKLGGEVGNN